MERRIGYEAPLAEVRGAFFVDGIADTVSIDDGVTRGNWEDGGTLKPTDKDEDENLWIFF
jgi:hypothetical protein